MSIVSDVKSHWGDFENHKHDRVAALPDTIMLELTNSCNLACTMCMNPKMTRKKGFMSLELVEKILIEADTLGIRKIALYTTGESFLHSKIFDIILLCKKYNMYTYVTTNLLLLDSEKIVKLFNTGIDSVKYSIDGLNQDEYEKIRIGGKYNKVIENIKEMKILRDSMESKTKLSIGIILSQYNISKRENYIQTYGSYVDEIIFSLISNQSGHISKSEYKNLKPSEVNISTQWKPCRQLWDRIVVTYDGMLTACCIDFENTLSYSNLETSSLKESWNNLRMKTFRDEHTNHKFKEMSLCKTCDSPYIQQVSIWNKLNGK